MSLNLPTKVRAAIYVALLVGGPVMIYLQAVNVVGANEMALWAALSSAVALLARINLTNDEQI